MRNSRVIVHFSSQVFENHSNPFFIKKWTYLRRMTVIIFLTEYVFFVFNKKLYHCKERSNDNILESWFSLKLVISIDTQDLGYKDFCIENSYEICECGCFQIFRYMGNFGIFWYNRDITLRASLRVAGSVLGLWTGLRGWTTRPRTCSNSIWRPR